ncbi:hypothetical protein [Lysobacter sp. GCM10012299]|uniref:hypothetical protein n=1 Tax=Lysobacter sp. GCM10012299 TaxID=3317333 RepID=UPI00361CD67E
MNSSNERLYRAIYAAIVGSRLSSRDLRKFVELLSSNSDFVHLLQKGLWEFADSLDYSFQKQARLDFDSPEVVSGSALIEMAVNKVQSDRISKSNLFGILSAVSRRASKGLDPSKQTVRQLVESFLGRASPEEAVAMLSLLGVEITQDPYLGGIDRKTGGGYE